MSKKKYKKGRAIKNMADFEKSKCDWFIVNFRKDATRHRRFLESWQYRVLYGFILKGRVYEAERIEGVKNGGK